MHYLLFRVRFGPPILKRFPVEGAPNLPHTTYDVVKELFRSDVIDGWQTGARADGILDKLEKAIPAWAARYNPVILDRNAAEKALARCPRALERYLATVHEPRYQAALFGPVVAFEDADDVALLRRVVEGCHDPANFTEWKDARFSPYQLRFYAPFLRDIMTASETQPVVPEIPPNDVPPPNPDDDTSDGDDEGPPTDRGRRHEPADHATNGAGSDATA
jgi:hypothetical protein